MCDRTGMSSSKRPKGYPRPHHCSSTHRMASDVVAGNSRTLALCAPRSHRVWLTACVSVGVCATMRKRRMRWHGSRSPPGTACGTHRRRSTSMPIDQAHVSRELLLVTTKECGHGSRIARAPCVFEQRCARQRIRLLAIDSTVHPRAYCQKHAAQRVPRPLSIGEVERVGERREPTGETHRSGARSTDRRRAGRSASQRDFG